MTKQIGGHVFVTPLGQVIERRGEVITSAASKTETTNAATANGDTKALQEARRNIAVAQAAATNLQTGFPSASNPTVSSSSTPQLCLWGEDILPKNKEFLDLVLQRSISDWQQAEEDLATYSQINICVKQNVQAIKGTGKKLFDLDGLLSEVLQLGLQLGLSKLNAELPPYAQLNLSLSPDGKGIENISVGGINYNPAKAEVYVGKEVFSTLVDKGLSGLNQTQPEYARVLSNASDLLFEGVTIPLKDLATVKDGEIVPSDEQALSENMQVGARPDGEVYVRKGNRFFDVGRLKAAGEYVAGEVFDYGLDKANAQLPDFLQVSRDSSGLNLGPVSYDPKTGKVGVSADTIESTLLSLAGPQLDRLAPKDSLGLLLWRAVDPLNLLSSLFKEVTRRLTAKPEFSYIATLDACTGEYAPLTPQVSGPFVDFKEMPDSFPFVFPITN
jgi:hypothetical protein